MYYHFEDALIVDCRGKSIERYLNSRLTANCKTAEINKPFKAAALNAQGRCEGYFTVIKKTPQYFRLYSDVALGGEVLAALKRFVVADLVEFEVLPLKLVFGVEPPVSVPLIECFPAIRMGVSGQDMLFGELPTNFAWIPKAEYEYRRAAAKEPTFPSEINHRYLFQESGLDFAISPNKGCYVGQEVIEKVDAFGRIAKKLVAIKFPPSEIEVGDRVQSESNQDVGEIITTYSGPDVVVFARIASSCEDNRLLCNNQAGIRVKP